MMTIRSLVRLHPAVRDDIADLVTRRPLPNARMAQLDPFLFLNHHGPQTYGPNNNGLPFGPHPHRGFETVTFILQGELSHLDSGGHESIIGAGGVQWMTAGRGLVHAELSPERFKRDGGPLEILQLWVNLPSALKMTTPAYRGLQGDEIPVVEVDGGRVRIEAVSGTWLGVEGAFTSLTGVAMAVVRLSAGAVIELPIDEGRAVFCYAVRGEARVGESAVPAYNLAELSDGDTLRLASEEEAVILLGHADPIGEPVVSHGPFVMNTEAEIVQAIRDYQAGKFGGLG